MGHQEVTSQTHGLAQQTCVDQGSLSPAKHSPREIGRGLHRRSMVQIATSPGTGSESLHMHSITDRNEEDAK